MTVSSRRVPTRTAERLSTRRSLVLDEVGGPAAEVRHLPDADRAVAYELAHELRCLCGSLSRTGGPGEYELQPLRGAWRCLRDVDEDTLTLTVRKFERIHPDWHLPSNLDEDIYERLDAFLTGGAR